LELLLYLQKRSQKTVIQNSLRKKLHDKEFFPNHITSSIFHFLAFPSFKHAHLPVPFIPKFDANFRNFQPPIARQKRSIKIGEKKSGSDTLFAFLVSSISLSLHLESFSSLCLLFAFSHFWNFVRDFEA
jgi:hypothetical protein